MPCLRTNRYMTDLPLLPAIQFEHVSKRFDFYGGNSTTVLEAVINRISPNKQKRSVSSHDLWAIKDASFDIMHGQSVGIIGKNGSGKSTALKLMTHILHPTEGKVTVRGRISALLELGAGFHPDLTGRDNIFLNAAVLGLGREMVAERYDQIVAFSELGDFIDMPVKHYSSGMYMRLGFSVAIHMEPDILIIDEILAVGDQAFQTKCLDRIYDMQRDGVTLIMVSHNLSIMRKMCERLIWMDKGKVLANGLTEDVAEQYNSYTADFDIDSMRQTDISANFKRMGSGEVRITAVRILNVEGDETKLFRTHDSLTIEMDYTAYEEIEQPEFGLAIHREDGLHINGPNTQFAGLDIEKVYGEGMVKYTIPDLLLMPARYLVTVAVHNGRFPSSYDYHEQAYTFRVIPGGTREEWGVVDMTAVWNWQQKTLE